MEIEFPPLPLTSLPSAPHGSQLVSVHIDTSASSSHKEEVPQLFSPSCLGLCYSFGQLRLSRTLRDQSLHHEEGSAAQQERAWHSFILPLSTQVSWTEGSIVDFTHRHISAQLLQWIGEGASQLFLSQASQCFGRVRWLDDLERYCLPVLIQFTQAWEDMHGSDIFREWTPGSLTKPFKCSIAYIHQWFSDVQSFGGGGEGVRFLFCLLCIHFLVSLRVLVGRIPRDLDSRPCLLTVFLLIFSALSFCFSCLSYI